MATEYDDLDDLPAVDVSHRKNNGYYPGDVHCECSGSGCTICLPCEDCEGAGESYGSQCGLCGGSGLRR